MVSNNGILEQCNFQVTLPHIWKDDISDVYDDLLYETPREGLLLDLQRTNTALESKVQELLAELSAAKEQLCREKASYQQIQTELEKSLKEIRFALKQEKQLAEDRAHLVSMASHEFRAPLNIISFSTSLLKRYHHCWTEEKKLQYLQQIETAVEQITHLMDEFLTLDRAEVGKLNFEPEALNLAQFCGDIVTELNFKSHDHSINFVSQGDCQSVCVDKKFLQSILMNLLSNAIKYSPVGTTVDVILLRQGKKIVFQIKDTGIGIPPAEQQRLFEPFYRGENAGDIPGNGLGLALVKKLVDLHHGQISVTSQVGLGTTFTITLPLCQPLKAEPITTLGQH